MSEYTTVAEAEAGMRDSGAHLQAVRNWQRRVEIMFQSLRRAEADAMNEYIRAEESHKRLLAEQPLPAELQATLGTINLAVTRMEQDVATITRGLLGLEEVA